MDKMKAIVDFDCIENDCKQTIQFDLLQLQTAKGTLSCSHCHIRYQFDRSFLSKLDKLRRLVLAVQDAEAILGDCNIYINTPTNEVKIPYRLLLTRLNTLISLQVSGTTIDFHFRVEPLTNNIK